MRLQQLKIEILKAGRTQREVAVAARIPETRLSDMIHGRAEPTANERVRIARTLGCPPDELFTEVGG